jgi:hypothetical protein
MSVNGVRDQHLEVTMATRVEGCEPLLNLLPTTFPFP